MKTAASFYNEQIVPVHITLFLLVSCSVTFRYLLCFVHGQRIKDVNEKTYNKELTEEFHK